MDFGLVETDKKCYARLAAPAAVDWLSRRSEARVLQVFSRSCNLISSGGSILSLVSTELGPGPFAITVEMIGSPSKDMPGIWEDVTVFSRVRISPEQIQIASVHINLSEAEIWNPKPAWEDISPGNLAQVYQLLHRLLCSYSPSSNAHTTINNEQLRAFVPKWMAAWHEMSAGLQKFDIVQAKLGAKKMAGLGGGLTPAGDDFLMGFIYSLWSQWDSKMAHTWATEIVKVASPLTTRLSATWLKAAANGEATENWHRLVNALINSDPDNLVSAASRILAVGHSSGSDALTGYIAGFMALSRVQSF
ncbi:MAG TPA: hypothetical protein DEP47_07655 [Chloroflexi bacterium]|nr:hypothetical protein [Chloroflexota bacterium]